VTVARSLVPACLFACTLIAGVLASPTRANAQSRVEGRVVDATGVAIVRLVVTLEQPDGTVVATAVTDDWGGFAFDAACGTCLIRATLPGFAGAQAGVTPGTPVTLALQVAPVRESVIVTATRGAAPTGQVGASVTVFDAGDITRRGAALVGDLLRQAPGTVVVQNGGQGNVTSLFVRGGESTYTRVLLDGIVLNEPGGTFNFGGLTTGGIERVEFVRGAQSALFGSDAMAGVVQLVSTRGTAGARPGLAVDLGGGSYGTGRGSATLTGGTGRWDYALHAGRYETDNRVPNNHFAQTTVSLTAGASLAPDLQVRLVGRYEDGTAGTPGQTAFGRPDLDARFTQSHMVGGMTLEHRPTPRFRQRISYAVAASEQRSTNLRLDLPYTPTYEDRQAPFEFYDFTYDAGDRFTRHQAGYQADLQVTHEGRLAGAEILTAAIDWEVERGTLSDYLAGSASSPERNNIGVSVQHQHISSRFALTSGLRVEHNGEFGTALAPRVSVAVILREGSAVFGTTRLKANAGRGIKEPTLRQSFSLSPFDLGNPALLAETSRSVDAGIEQRLFRDRGKVDVVWFDNRFDRQISTRTISFSPYTAQYFNVGRTRARGAEISAELVPTQALRLFGSYTFTGSRIIDASSEFSDILAAGQWALRRPRHAAQVLAGWERGRLSVDAGGTYSGRRSDSDFSSLIPAITSSGGYWLWRLQAQVRVTSLATGYVRVENLTDANYMEPLGYPAWRRTVHAGLRLRF